MHVVKSGTREPILPMCMLIAAQGGPTLPMCMLRAAQGSLLFLCACCEELHKGAYSSYMHVKSCTREPTLPMCMLIRGTPPETTEI